MRKAFSPASGFNLAKKKILSSSSPPSIDQKFAQASIVTKMCASLLTRSADNLYDLLDFAEGIRLSPIHRAVGKAVN